MSETRLTAAHPPAPSARTAGAPTAAGAPPWRALPVLLAGVFLSVLDFFIVNVAMPSMQVQLHAGPSALEWVVAGYGLGFAALLMTSGQLGERWGRRRLFGVGVALFTLTSAACALAPDPEVLIAARIAQGGAAALLSPAVLVLIGTLFHGADRARAVSLYATVMGVAAVGGQLIGGLLLALDVGGLGWRSVFLINVPIGLVAVVATPRLVPPTPVRVRPAIDVPGPVLIGAGLAALVLPLTQGRQEGWPLWTWASLAAAPVLIGAFGLHQLALRRRSRPVLFDPGLFRSRAFGTGMLAQLLLWSGQASYFLVLALYLQQGRGLGPLAAGGVFTLVAASYLLASALAPRLAARHGRSVVTLGAALLAAGHLVLALVVARTGARVPVLELAPGLLLAGAGMGLCIAVLTASVLSGVEPATAGAVSGALGTVQQVGNSIGVAAVGMVYFGALPGGPDHAFTLALEALAGLLAVLALVTRLLPAARTA